MSDTTFAVSRSARLGRLAATAYITVPIAVRSTKEPARKAVLNETRITLRTLPGSPEFDWRYFVTMHEERFGVWLGIDSDAAPIAIDPGSVLFREILHQPRENVDWGRLLRAFETESVIAIRLTASIDGKSYSQDCSIRTGEWQPKIKALKEKTGRVPGRITATCARGDEEVNR
jgi:hypothetical protein